MYFHPWFEIKNNFNVFDKTDFFLLFLLLEPRLMIADGQILAFLKMKNFNLLVIYSHDD